MTERRVNDWIRKHIVGKPMTIQEAYAMADRKMDPPGWRRLCYARLVLGSLRYQTLGVTTYDAVGSAIDRLVSYQQDGNREHLVDAANLCRVEWLNPAHPAPCWRAQGSEGPHAEQVNP